MTLYTVSGGIVQDPLTTNRAQKYVYQLFTTKGAPLGSLGGVLGGSIEWNSTAQVKAGGKLTVTDTGQNIDWLSTRIRPVLQIEGLPNKYLGLYIPAAPTEKWDLDGRTWDLEILDRTSVIQQDQVDSTYALDAGANIIAAVKALIASTGESTTSILDASYTLRSHIVKEAGTSKLTIINELLAAAGYRALFMDSAGALRAELQIDPSKRPLAYDIVDNSKSIYTPDFTLDRDIYSIPNKVIAIAQGDANNNALVGVATNVDPKSPYSQPSRGRWITSTVTGVEAQDQATIDAFAKRSLAQQTSVARVFQINHAPMDWHLDDRVRFRRTTAGIDANCTVTKVSLDLDPTALAKTTITEVLT